MRECPKCLFTNEIPGVTIRDQCTFCDIQDSLHKRYDNQETELFNIIKKIKKKQKNKRYDCLVTISGGFDSSYMLHLVKEVWGLRPLAFHFDNGWNTEEAENNMRVMTKDVDFVRYKINITARMRQVDSVIRCLKKRSSSRASAINGKTISI